MPHISRESHANAQQKQFEMQTLQKIKRKRKKDKE